MDSILNSVKKGIGLSEDYNVFDDEIIDAINAAFFTLWTLGVGDDKSKPFVISDADTEWSEFISDNKIEACRNYVKMRTRLQFDPPTSSFLLEAIKEQVQEFEFRMMVATDEYELAESS